MVAMGLHRAGHLLLRDGPHPVREVLARQAGIDQKTGQLTAVRAAGPGGW